MRDVISHMIRLTYLQKFKRCLKEGLEVCRNVQMYLAVFKRVQNCIEE